MTNKDTDPAALKDVRLLRQEAEKRFEGIIGEVWGEERLAFDDKIYKKVEVKMNRTLVSSSNLISVGYDLENMVLEIEFHSGGIYQYFNVPESKYDGLMSADSHGKYFDAYIKKGGYRFKQIR